MDYEPKPFKLDLAPAPEPDAAPQQPQMPDPQHMRIRLQGRARDVNDIDLTISGIADGDPVGMETFDLGFFEDGTPAIVINGANVPIRHEQWMALLNMREKSRYDMERMTEFRVAQDTAMNAIKQVESAIDLPDGMAPLLYAQAQIDPSAATKALQSLYLEMQKGGGQELMGRISRDITEAGNRNALDFLTKDRGQRTEMVSDPRYPHLAAVEQKIRIPSIRDERIDALRTSPAERDQITMLAWQKLEDFVLDPNYRVANPTGRIGMFDRLAREQDRSSPMSLLSRLQHIAAYHGGAWPQTVPIEPPPPMFASSALPGLQGMPITNPRERERFMDYLIRLDRWAASAFNYQLSSRESLEQVANEMTMNYWHLSSQMMQQQAQPASSPANQTTPQGQRRISPSAI